jgi:2-dehydropantoate 2-reductase
LSRILIAGAGAVGGHLAVRLAEAGREVAVLARGAHLEAIRSRGLTLEGPEDSVTVRLAASDDPAALGRFDLILVTAKHTALASLAARLAPCLDDATPVVFAQNGILWFYPAGRAGPPLPRLDPQGLLARTIGIERALGMIIYSANEVVAPGHVRATGHRNRFLVGGSLGRTGRAEPVVERLRGCRFVVEPVAEIRAAMWAKLAANVSGGPLCALTGARLDKVAADAGMATVMRALIAEAIAVAAAEGFKALGLDIERMSVPGGRPAHTPSIAQDLTRGRPMEIDAMLAAVHDLARHHGIATPTLDVVLPLLAARARAAGCYPTA